MHSHDFRDAAEFKGRRLLVVGSSYSAEDIAMQGRNSIALFKYQQTFQQFL